MRKKNQKTLTSHDKPTELEPENDKNTRVKNSETTTQSQLKNDYTGTDNSTFTAHLQHKHTKNRVTYN